MVGRDEEGWDVMVINPTIRFCLFVWLWVVGHGRADIPGAGYASVLIVIIHRPDGLIVAHSALSSLSVIPRSRCAFPCFNRGSGYDMTNRSKSRRGREVAAEDAAVMIYAAGGPRRIREECSAAAGVARTSLYTVSRHLI